MSENISHLSKEDKALYCTDNGNAEFNLNLYITPENIEELLAKETIKSESEMIVKVKMR